MRRFVISAVLVAISGCSYIWPKDQSQAAASAQATTSPAAAVAESPDEMEPMKFSTIPPKAPAPTPQAVATAAPTPPQLSEAEIEWEIPKEPVSKYIIYYGSSPNSLNQQVTVSSTDLEQIDDASAGFVYRYTLKDLPANQPLFISISSVTTTGESIRSAPMEVK